MIALYSTGSGNETHIMGVRIHFHMGVSGGIIRDQMYLKIRFL